MAEWAAFKAEKILQKFSVSLPVCLLIALLGSMLARANILGIYPFAIAYMAVLSLDKDKKVFFGFLGIIIGILSIRNLAVIGEVLPACLLCVLLLPRIKGHKAEIFLLPIFTAFCTIFPGLLVLQLTAGIGEEALILLLAQSTLAAGFSVIFFHAFLQKENLLKGSFTSEQGMIWLLILAVCLSGLQGLTFGKINCQIAVLGFFILFISDRFGAGAGAGAGAILGFLLKWDFGLGNLLDAGIYGLLGFVCGGFQNFGKVGIAVAYSSMVLMVTFFVNESFLTSHLYSAGLGLLLFLVLPGKRKDKVTFKKRVMPEIETTISKVKTLADIFDQLAYSFQAAGLESKLKPEVPELMNVLVGRICKNCAMVDYCWEREFYRTYNFIYDLFAYEEEQMNNPETAGEIIPSEWKKYCGKLEEVRIAVRFILEQQKDREIWQKRLALNRESLADQYRHVAQVIGHLAKELHSKHNLEEGKPLVWSRQHRLQLDIGVGTVIKTGNGISGDNFNSVPLSPNKSALIVCDGMGVGEEAARMSAAALTILEQLLSTGFEPEGAVKALNSILVLRSPEESFVTVDMAIIDLETDSAKLIKIGAAPTYLLRKGKVEILKTSSLPAGILNDIEIPVLDVKFKDETLVIVTDGILDVGKQEEDWLKVFLESSPLASAQELADNIIKETIRLAGGNLVDDGVVLVLRRKN
ncbi:MAG TPA: SpoIIE family protein phosphatase [Peptococcaceae bacterium]|nr:SpoIIE family protein phosphatase [Peptococcaceae bacterium]